MMTACRTLLLPRQPQVMGASLDVMRNVRVTLETEANAFRTIR